MAYCNPLNIPKISLDIPYPLCYSIGMRTSYPTAMEALEAELAKHGTQKALAVELQIDEAYLSRILRREVKIPKRILDILGYKRITVEVPKELTR